MRLFFLCISLVLFLNAKDVTNGTVSILEFDANTTKALYKEGALLPLLAHPTNPLKRIAFIAVPYRHTKDIELLHVSMYGNEKIHLSLQKGAYKQESLTVEPSQVSPPKVALARIQAEAKEAKALYATFNPKRLWSSFFELPLQSKITSAYGNARVFNDSLQSYHSGVDFRAAIGTPIYASNDGIVALAKERYYAGNSMIIDHGEGIYSVYYHLSERAFAVGEFVKKGDKIGLSGVSGRVTGPHLHFGFMVQGVPVDPYDFMYKIAQLF